MYIGADYYPEHWSKENWPQYAKWMKQGGFNVVRLAEFAWAFMEPEEGRFDFSLFDEALAGLAKQGISAILCTPTAVMPAWCARKYPETLLMEPNGERMVWGVRKNNCFSSGAYRLLSERITRAMAEHFKDTPNVIGWQTDNEFGGHSYCHCHSCRQDFQDWLRRKYGTIEKLNRAWGSHFWGHLYYRWDEIHIPVGIDGHNPSQCLDYQRFFSHQNVQFQHDQVVILRDVCPKHFVTHNFMGLFQELDYFDLAKELDFVSWDNYPVGGKPGMMYDASMGGDLMRGLKSKNFWVMEMSAGPAGWGSFGRNPRPGEMDLISLHQVAHGADGLVWFRWRTCTAGREQYWHGLLGHDGQPQRRYREAAATAKRFHKLAPYLAGTTVKSEVAMIYDYDSLWALRIQPGYPNNHLHDALRRYYQALLRAGVNVDMIQATADLSKYKVVIAPDLNVMPDAVAKNLDAFVKAGGVLVTDCRTGVKDETNLCHARTLPGLLSKALGIRIEEYESLSETYPVTGFPESNASFTADKYADWITPVTAEKLAGYTQWHLASFAAITRNRYGKGIGYYLGTVIQEPAFFDAYVKAILADAKVKPVIHPPAGVEVSIRQGKGKKLVFIMNHTDEEKTVPVPKGKKELLSGKTTDGELALTRFGIAVLLM